MPEMHMAGFPEPPVGARIAAWISLNAPAIFIKTASLRAAL
jgi:hypothetical protein